MNTHDIELPPLPLHPSVAHMGGRHMQADCQFPSLYVWAKNYARAAIEPYVETLFKIGEHLGIDYQEARTAPGKPSDVYIAAIEVDRKRRGEPVAVIRYERNTPGRENEMPRVISCNRLPDGDYPVFTAPQPAEPVAWPEIELTPEQDEKYNSWVGSDSRKGFERMVARLAYKLNTSGRGLVDYDAAQHFATELRTIFALAASPQPAEPSRSEPVGYIMPTALKQLKAGGNAIVGGVSQGCDVAVYLAPQPTEPVKERPETTSEHIARDIREGRFPKKSERQTVPAEPVVCFKCGHATHGGECVNVAPQPAENSVNLEVAIQAISALHSNDTDWDTSYWNQAVGRCVSELNKLRSQRPAEPVKVPSDAEMAAIWDEAHKPFGGAPFLMSHVEYSRALLARYGQPTAREDADDLYVAYLCGLADGKKTTNTLPTPKPDPHYEEGATDVFDHAQRQAYVDGWNECLEAIKKGLKRT